MDEAKDPESISMRGLSPWEKMVILSVGASIVGVSLLIVICLLGRHCWIRKILRKRNIKQQKEPWSWPLYGTNGLPSDQVQLWEKNNNQQLTSSNNNNDKNTANNNNSKTNNSSCLIWFRSSKGEENEPAATELSSCSSVSSGDSRASSNRSSSTNMSIKTAFSSLSFKNRFRHNSLGEESLSSSSLSPSLDKPELSAVNVGLYWRVPSPGEPCGKLAVSIMSCTDLPHREYGGAVDSYVQLSVLKERGRSLRRRNPPLSLSDWKTKTVRHSFNPVFDQTFSVDISETDFKSIQLKFTAYDVDRHTKTSEIGHTFILLRDIKLLTNNIMDQKITTTSYFARKGADFGELLFGMSYLPTAQRMSFSIVKATNLKYETVAPNLEVFFPYVRILHLSSNYKVLKKKKTTAKTGKRDPNYNETLNFEVPPSQLESSTFVILLYQRVNAIEMREVDGSGDSSSPGALQKEESGSRDICMGRICIGRRVSGDKERAHWLNVVQNPRKVFSTWQTFH